MSNSENRLFLRSYGAVIPASAVGTIMFNTWSEVSYSLERAERVVNPLVYTTETVFASAVLQILDPKIAKQLAPETDEEEEEEDEAPKKRGRGRPAAKQEEEVAPTELEIVFYKKGFITAAEPLNISAPIVETMEISDKNERKLTSIMASYSDLFTQLEIIRENISQDVSGAHSEVSAVVDDMLGTEGKIEGLQQSAVEEYRNKQRRQENRIIVNIDEFLTKFANTIAKRSYATEAEPLITDIVVGDKIEPLMAIINQFFRDELVSME